jgi:hypothetical protein
VRGDAGLIRLVELSAPRATPGRDLGFRVELSPPALPLDLFLSVSYRDGRTEAIDLHAGDEIAELRWPLSPTAAIGPAEFSLFAVRPCPTCGGGPILPLRDRVDGTFPVVDA